MSRYLKILLILLVLTGLLTAHADMREASEYEVKAAYIYNFAKLAEWPESSLDSTLNICSLGETHFMKALKTIEGKSVGERVVSVRAISSPTDASACQILFIPSTEKGNLGKIVRHLPPGVLTVGDTEGFAREGVMINMFLEKSKVQFEVNIESVRRARIVLSSRLLNLARIVREVN